MSSQLLNKIMWIKPNCVLAVKNMSIQCALLFSKTFEDGVNVLEGFVDLISDLGSGQDDFSRDENQQDYPRFDHSVDETGE